MDMTMVARVSDIPKGEGKIFQFQGKEIALFHLESGEILAIENHCPHRGGPLAHGILCGEAVICPLHGWRIDLRSGEVLDEKDRVEVYPVRIERGEIRVSVQNRTRTPNPA